MKTNTIAALASLLAGSAHAAVLVTPSSIAYTVVPEQEDEGNNLATEANLINSSGLTGTPDITNYATTTHSAVSLSAPGNVWATIDPGAGGGDFYTQGGIPPVFTMSLDQTYDLTDFVYWGYFFGTTANGNEGRQFQLEFSTDGGATFPASTTVESPLGTIAVADANTLSLGSTFQADLVRMTVLDNHFGATGINGGDRVGLGEIRFIGDAIPEPSTGLLGSIALLALLRRRR